MPVSHRQQMVLSHSGPCQRQVPEWTGDAFRADCAAASAAGALRGTFAFALARETAAHLLHTYRNNDGRILCGPIRFFRKKATINRSGHFWTALAGFCYGRENGIAHIFTKDLSLLTEY